MRDMFSKSMKEIEKTEGICSEKPQIQLKKYV